VPKAVLLTLPTAAEDLALDEALLVEAERSGGEWLRLWEWPRTAVVLGAGGRRAEEVHETACAEDGVPILRRSSGGGAVVLGPGCLLFALVVAYERDPRLTHVNSSYAYIMERIAHALAPLAPGIGLAGTSDLAWDGRKVSGNSQQRKRHFLLHHGTLLYAFDLPLIARYLKTPPRQPEYREKREHLDFVTNLPATREQMMQAIRAEWGLPMLGAVNAATMEVVQALVDEKYGKDEWVKRR
jgi:lipoate-protein ligase A